MTTKTAIAIHGLEYDWLAWDADTLAAVDARSPQGEVEVAWPAFSFEPQILPTAAKVELEVVVTHPPGWRASCCWGPTVEPSPPNTMRARSESIAPTKELTIYFFPSWAGHGAEGEHSPAPASPR